MGSSIDGEALSPHRDLTPVLVYPESLPAQRLFRRGRLLASFDSAGVECAAGRVFWGDVESVALVESRPDWHGVTVWRLSFRLRAGAQPLAPSGDYNRGRGESRAQCSEVALSLPLWDSARSVLATVRRFYDGPSADVFPHHEPRGWPGDDIGPFTDDLEREREQELNELLHESGGETRFLRSELRRWGREDSKRVIGDARANGEDEFANRLQGVFDALEKEGWEP